MRRRRVAGPRSPSAPAWPGPLREDALGGAPTWLQVGGVGASSCQASRIGSATSSSCRPAQCRGAVDLGVLRAGSRRAAAGASTGSRARARAARSPAAIARWRSGRGRATTPGGRARCACDRCPRPRPSTATRCRRRGRPCAPSAASTITEVVSRAARWPLPRRYAAARVGGARSALQQRGHSGSSGLVEAAARARAPAVFEAGARGGAEPERERGALVAGPSPSRAARAICATLQGVGAASVQGPVHPEVVAQVASSRRSAPRYPLETTRVGRAPSASARRRTGRRGATGAHAVAPRRRRRCRCWSGERRVGAARRACTGGTGERLEAGRRTRTAERREVGHVGLGDPPAPERGGVDLAVGEAAPSR